MTSQGEQFAELTYCKCEFHYTHPLSPLVPYLRKRWVAVRCGDKGSDRDRRVSSGQYNETVIEEDVRGTACTVQAFARNTAETRVASFSRWLSTRPMVSSGYRDKAV